MSLDGNTYALNKYLNEQEVAEQATESFEKDVQDEIDELEKLAAVLKVIENNVESEAAREKIVDVLNDEAGKYAAIIEDKAGVYVGFDFDDHAKALINEAKGDLEF